MSDRTLDIPVPSDAVGAEPALAREERLETRVRRLEAENAQLHRDRLQAGLSGGFVTVALATTNTPEALAAQKPHRIVKDLSEVDPAWLVRGLPR